MTLGRMHPRIAERLRGRRSEFVRLALLQAGELDDSLAVDPTYSSYLPKALSAMYEYFAAAVESGGVKSSLPADLRSQAQIAAAFGLSLDALLRRCVAVNSLMTLFLVEECEGAALSSQERAILLRTQKKVFDSVAEFVCQEYRREQRWSGGSTAGRPLEVVRALLAGEPIDPLEFPYDFEHRHLAIICRGESYCDALTAISQDLNGELLVVKPGGSIQWAWLGTRHAVDSRRVRAAVQGFLQDQSVVGVGGCESGIDGWQATHRQAKAAFAVALRQNSPSYYEDVALTATAMVDPLLGAFLRKRYLEPIGRGRAGDAALLDTLRAYFEADRNGVSASAALGISRQTVTNRLRSVEELVGRSLSSCAADLELALHLHDLEGA